MEKAELADTYRAYIACLNAQDWANLGRFVHREVLHNGRAFGLAGYRAMLEDDYRRIPDLRFNVALLVVDPPHVACRLAFDCSPRGEFLGLEVKGRRIRFDENVFYRFQEGRIAEVWSILDRQAVTGQLRAAGSEDQPSSAREG